MADLDDLLLGEFAVNFGYVTRAQIAEFQSWQEAGDGRTLEEMLVDEGFATPQQLAELRVFQSAEERPTTAEEEDRHQKTQRIAKMKRYARSGEVEDALRVQKEIETRDSDSKRLSEFLLLKSEVTASQAAGELAAEGVTIFLCETCCVRYRVRDYDPSRTYLCKRCRARLRPPGPVQLSE